MISADTFFSGKSAELAALAFRHGVPTISPYREFVRAGGLMSYGGEITERLNKLQRIRTLRVAKEKAPNARMSVPKCLGERRYACAILAPATLPAGGIR